MTAEICSEKPTPNCEKQPDSLSFLRSYLVCIVLCCVALCQFYHVHVKGLNSWRGGGFGMYAGFHPRQHEAWLVYPQTDTQTRYMKYGGPVTEHAKIIRPCITYPNHTFVDRIESQIAQQKQSDVELQIWRLDFDRKSLQLTRRNVLEDSGGPSR